MNEPHQNHLSQKEFFCGLNFLLLFMKIVLKKGFFSITKTANSKKIMKTIMKEFIPPWTSIFYPFATIKSMQLMKLIAEGRLDYFVKIETH